MALWDRLSTELRSAGKAARGAIDEGKIRLELFASASSPTRRLRRSATQSTMPT